MKAFHDGKVTVHAGDCLDVLKAMPKDSIDAVVTDPPYHLTNNNGTRSPYPGQYTPIGKPKQPKGGFMGKQWDGGDIAFRPELWAEVLRMLKPGGHMVCFGGTRTYHRMVCAIEDAGFEVRDQLAWVYGSGFPKSHNIGNGWGTALKPAWEPICLARKPLSEGTVAANVLRWGIGAINIDGCRVSLDASENVEKLNARSGGRRGFASEYVGGNDHPLPPGCDLSKGRWPANLCHDGSPEVMAGFPESVTAKRNPETCGGDMNNSVYGEYGARKYDNTYADSGNAARFFYTSKADSNDRLGSRHPTVKPVDLMQWLIRLVCPKGATILDPFSGTGTTGEAAFREGCRTVLIEREAEYLADIERRMGMLLSGTDERARKLATPDAHESLPLFALAGE